MTLDPIIKAKMEQYKEDYFLSDVTDDALFERFAIDNILSQIQPEIFKTDYDLLDQICVGGGEDLGIDGIAISLNDQFIRSCSDINDILEGNRRGHFEFYFIQVKNKKSFDLGEYMKFTAGMEDFLNGRISPMSNDAVKSWQKIFNYIMSSEVISRWSTYPDVKWFFVVNGLKDNIPHIEENAEVVKGRLADKKTYGEIEYSIIDSNKLLEIINVNENNYSFVMNLVDSMSLPEVNQVDGSSVILCSAMEIIKMLSTPDGLLRRNIFDDNVRDYQGDTTINQEITNTIKNEAERFVLLNNGITIVCDEVREINRKISISNPRVVNGCQTCSILFQNYKDHIDLDNIYVIVKIIASANADIVNSIVKGTNRQNIVYEEAFEVTRDFHKKLEEFFYSFSIEGKEKIYYERRSKQYDNNVPIAPLQKVTFRILIQSFITLFLFKPENGHSHESKLLRMYKNKIFIDSQSYYPYYAAAYIYLFAEKMFRAKKIDKRWHTYIMQVILIFKELIGGESPDINKKKKIESYCSKIFQVLKDDQHCEKVMGKAVELFQSISDAWIEEKGEAFKDGRKDNPEFTRFILTKVRDRDYVERVTKEIGRVLLVSKDCHGCYYGFIERDPDNIFFHENENLFVDFSLRGKWVSYDLKETDRGMHAVNVVLLDMNL